MDIRYVSWAGYQFEESGTGVTVTVTVDAGNPEIFTDNIGEIDINANELKPKIVTTTVTNE